MGRFIEGWLNKKLNSKRIMKHMEGIKPQKVPRDIDKDDIIVSCVQRSIKPVGKIEDYINMAESFVSQAAKEGSDMIVFPEYNFFDLLGILPGIRIINTYMNSKPVKTENSGKEDSSDNSSGLLKEIFLSIAKPIQNAIELIMCDLAKKHGIYIYTGSYFIREENNIYNGGAMISRRGDIIGIQKKLHLTDFEEGLGIKRGNSFNVFELDIGKVVCPICMDATYFETFSIARSLGCDIVILPIANNEEYRLFRALRGIWPRVQESFVYGIKSSLNGWFCGLHFTGKAGIFAPLELTEKKDGIISISKEYEGDILITGKINVLDLHKARENNEYFGDINPDFEKDYFIKTYKGV